MEFDLHNCDSFMAGRARAALLDPEAARPWLALADYLSDGMAIVRPLTEAAQAGRGEDKGTPSDHVAGLLVQQVADELLDLAADYGDSIPRPGRARAEHVPDVLGFGYQIHRALCVLCMASRAPDYPEALRALTRDTAARFDAWHDGLRALYSDVRLAEDAGR